MKRIVMIISTIAMALALTACGGEEQKATTWSESHYEKAQETQGAFAYAETSAPAQVAAGTQYVVVLHVPEEASE